MVSSLDTAAAAVIFTAYCVTTLAMLPVWRFAVGGIVKVT